MSLVIVCLAGFGQQRWAGNQDKINKPKLFFEKK